MELSKDKAVAMQQCVDLLKQSRAEVFSFDGVKRQWVACFKNDFLPMRENKRSIGAMVGGNVYCSMSYGDALRVAKGLGKIALDSARKNNVEPQEVIVMEACEWSKRRCEILDNLIAGWIKQAAEQGVEIK